MPLADLASPATGHAYRPTLSSEQSDPRAKTPYAIPVSIPQKKKRLGSRRACATPPLPERDRFHSRDQRPASPAVREPLLRWLYPPDFSARSPLNLRSPRASLSNR